MGGAIYKIGQVATRLGISVRTLRHYEAMGLIKSASRAATGHRLYTEADVARLQKIVALRKLGFPLNQVRTVLSDNTDKAFKALEEQAARLREQITQQQGVLKSVEAVLDFKDMQTRFMDPGIDH